MSATITIHDAERFTVLELGDGRVILDVRAPGATVHIVLGAPGDADALARAALVALDKLNGEQGGQS